MLDVGFGLNLVGVVAIVTKILLIRSSDSLYQPSNKQVLRWLADCRFEVASALNLSLCKYIYFCIVCIGGH